MSRLTERRCVPGHGEGALLSREAIASLTPQVPAWEVMEQHHLARTFRTDDFRSALDLVNRIGSLAEEEGHHPDLRLGWGRVEVEIWTHDAGGLTENDFILAAKIDALEPPPD